MTTERSITFLESQLMEIDNILKYSNISRTYQARRNIILRKLAFKYMLVKFGYHEHTVIVMSRM